MGDTKDKEIIIKHITSGGLSGEALKGCWFIRHGNIYTFYDHDGVEKARDIHVGQHFSFTLDEAPDVNWTLSITNPEGPAKLTGSWKDSTNPALADGSYQAEAGGSGEEGDADAASAAGYSS
jgi:hypothetical protein